MSATMGGNYKGTTKQTCRACNRTVIIVMIDGVRVATDPELISVVELGTAERLQARRVHGDMCAIYQKKRGW